MSAHLERLIRIYNRLRRGPVTIEIISSWAKNAAIHVSDRQLYRDLEQLSQISFAEGETVREFINEKNKKTWKLEYKQPSEKISAFDINSFFLLKNFAPFAVLEERRKSIEKFEKTIYKSFSRNNYQQYIQANELYLSKTNYYENMYGAEEHKKIEDLIWSLHNNRVIVIEQDIINAANNNISPEDFSIEIYPMELVFHRGRMHIAGVTKSMQFMIFAIDKDFHYSLTNHTFNRTKFLSIYNQHFQKLFGISIPLNDKVYNIKLELTKNYAESLKSFHWHHTQQWKQLKNGNYMLTMRCTIGRELIGFIATGLAMIKVHQPKILRDLMLKKFTETVSLYQNDDPLDEARANEGM